MGITVALLGKERWHVCGEEKSTGDEPMTVLVAARSRGVACEPMPWDSNRMCVRLIRSTYALGGGGHISDSGHAALPVAFL